MQNTITVLNLSGLDCNGIEGITFTRLETSSLSAHLGIVYYAVNGIEQNSGLGLDFGGHFRPSDLDLLMSRHSIDAERIQYIESAAEKIIQLYTGERRAQKQRQMRVFTLVQKRYAIESELAQLMSAESASPLQEKEG